MQHRRTYDKITGKKNSLIWRHSGFTFCRCGKEGFALIETVIATLIMGITVGGLLSTFVMGRVNVAKAKHRMQATNIVQLQMEVFRNTQYGSIASQASTPVLLDNNGTTGTGDDLMAAIRTDVVEIFSGCKQVTVTLDWNELSSGGGESALSEQMVTMISQR
jgi:Tfp pilus assembly protein PilV